MRLVVLCPHFDPDTAPTGVVISRIVRELVARGHEIEVVTSLPWYEHHKVDPAYGGRLVRRCETRWGSITRVHPFPSPKDDILRRAVAFGAFSVLVAAATAKGPKADGVLAMSPPLPLGYAGRLVASARRAPLVFNVQDIFPDVAVDLGILTNPRLIAATRRLERATYRASDAVTVLSQDLADNVAAKIGPDQAAKVRVIPNFVDTVAITPRPKDNSFRRELDAPGPVVMYAGNVGLSQPLDLLIEVARRRPEVTVAIVGNGAGRAPLEAAAKGIDNVRFVDFQPFERLPDVLAAADVHAVVLKKGLARASVPSKMYSILAAARPFIASVDPGTEVARVAEEQGAGLAVPPEDPDALTGAVDQLLADPDEAQAMGARGRRFVEGWASPAAVAEAYESLFLELARSGSTGPLRRHAAGRGRSPR